MSKVRASVLGGGFGYRCELTGCGLDPSKPDPIMLSSSSNRSLSLAYSSHARRYLPAALHWGFELEAMSATLLAVTAMVCDEGEVWILSSTSVLLRRASSHWGWSIDSSSVIGEGDGVATKLQTSTAKVGVEDTETVYDNWGFRSRCS